MTASIDALRRAIRERLAASPWFAPIPESPRVLSHSAKMDRYVTTDGQGLAHEHSHSTVQHLWVRADSVAQPLIEGIEHRCYEGRSVDGRTGRHSNLAQIPGFADSPLLRFTPKTAEEAGRILDALAGGRASR